jgi:hypothetical protein
MSNHDYYLLVRHDNTVSVYSFEHIHFGTYSSLSKCHELFPEFLKTTKAKLAAYQDNTWFSLATDADWVTFILSRSAQ